MSRLIIVLTLGIVVFLFRQKLKSLPSEKRKPFLLATTLWSVLAVALLMVLTGHAHWFVAAIAALGPLLKNLAGLAIRSYPLLQLWLKKGQDKTGSNQQPNTSTDDISEAYQILGLTPGATKEEVNTSYKKLIQKNHPDRGGNDYLAAKLNSAKETLLRHIS